MNILFMSLSNYQTIYLHGLYSDLLRQFVEHGDEVFVIAPIERKNSQKEQLIKEKGATIVKVKILNMQKTNVIEKGISMLTIDHIFKKAIKKYFGDVKFDLILYPTPPITLHKVVDYVKRRDGAKSYLLLKDIFPQNAIDIGIMTKKGVKGALYKFFRRQEKKLYAVSDYIGCMSKANVNYILSHNPEVNPGKIEVCPNSADLLNMSCPEDKRIEIRNKYSIPLDRKVFIYGGNLGKPQGIPYLIKCLNSQIKNKNVFFVIAGAGTEYRKLQRFLEAKNPGNIKLFEWLPKEEYNAIVGACDVGMIFLDHRFTIPNFPSRLLTYLQAKIPVLACTDPNTDIGKIIEDGGFGWWCESSDIRNFQEIIRQVSDADCKKMGESGFRYMKAHYTSEIAYEIIRRRIKKESGLY